MKNPFFSIIVPIYNRAENVFELVECVKRQTYEKWELILVDDGSTDNTAEKCRECSEDDSRVKYIHKNNGGVCTARNMGIDAALGDYIVFLDSDNALAEQALAILGECITHFDTEMLCFGYESGSNSWLPCENGRTVLVTRETIRKNYLPQHLNIVPQNGYFLKNYVWNKCYKRQFITSNQMRFDENKRTWEDGQFMVNCLDKSNGLILVGEALYDCGVDDGRGDHLSSKLFENQIHNYISDEKDYFSRFGNEMDFSSIHYNTSNFHLLDLLLSRSTVLFRAGALDIISDALNEELVAKWANCAEISTKSAAITKLFIVNRRVNSLYCFYIVRNLSRAALNKLKSILKR